MNAELSWVDGGARRFRSVTAFPDARKGSWRFQLPNDIPSGVSLLLEIQAEEA